MKNITFLLLLLAQVAFSQNLDKLIETASKISQNIEALSYLKNTSDNELKAVIYNNLAYSYGITGQFKSAIENYKQTIVYKTLANKKNPRR